MELMEMKVYSSYQSNKSRIFLPGQGSRALCCSALLQAAGVERGQLQTQDERAIVVAWLHSPQSLHSTHFYHQLSPGQIYTEMAKMKKSTCRHQPIMILSLKMPKKWGFGLALLDICQVSFKSRNFNFCNFPMQCSLKIDWPPKSNQGHLQNSQIRNL